jgi:hypothetical protein
LYALGLTSWGWDAGSRHDNEMFAFTDGISQELGFSINDFGGFKMFLLGYSWSRECHVDLEEHYG